MTDVADRLEEKGPTGKVGNLGKAVELNYSPQGKAWCHFSLAVQRRGPDGKVDRDGDPDWYTVKAFGELAEHAAECLTTGTRVVVVGKAQLRHWSTPEGKSGAEKIILADGLGPDLRWQTAEVSKVERKAASHDQTTDDEEPF